MTHDPRYYNIERLSVHLLNERAFHDEVQPKVSKFLTDNRMMLYSAVRKSVFVWYMQIARQYDLSTLSNTERSDNVSWLMDLVVMHYLDGDRTSINNYHDSKPNYHRGYSPVQQPTQEPTQPEGEETMSTPFANAKAVEVKTFIFGNDIDKLSTNEVLNIIAGLEAEVKKLESITNQPRRIAKAIEKLNDDIKAVVTALDAREE